MKIANRGVMLLVLCGIAAGCTQAGPFVTNVSTAGPNKLLVEKCHVHMNAFMGTISNDQCTTHELQLQTH